MRPNRAFDDPSPELSRRSGLILVLLLVLAGFWLRLRFLLGEIYHIDEFISMLAAQMVAEKGLPIFPSGLFYDHGLLQSLLSGGFVALLDFREEIVRWPTLLLGTATIAVYYLAGRTLFGSRAAGLLAAALFTFDVLAIQWSVRARMYLFAHLFLLLTLTWLLRSLFQAPSERGRYLLLLFLSAALLSHTVVFVTLPVLALLGLLFTLLRPAHRRWLKQPHLWLQVIVGGGVLAGLLQIVRSGQTGSTVSLQDSQPGGAVGVAGLEFLDGFFSLGFNWDRYDNLVYFFSRDYAYQWFLLPIGLALILALVRLVRRRATFADWAVCFLALYTALMVLELGGLFDDNWRKARYLFMINLPAFILLAGEGVRRLLVLLAMATQKATRWRVPARLLPYLGLLALVWLLAPAAWDAVDVQGTGDYNTAFPFVEEQWQGGDRVMTIHPAAAYLYLRHNDYYANQVSAKVLPDEDGPLEVVDRYTGRPLVDSVEELNRVLAESPRLWFVIDYSRLFRRYDYRFTQQILSQMNMVRRFGPVYVFLSETFPRPVPPEPAATVDGRFERMAHLGGYSLDLATLAPDGTLPLHLYWRPLGEYPGPYKVFVQLRNGAGETIAQADHFLFEGVITAEEWQDLQEDGEWLRETAMLQINYPLPADQGPYRIYIGFYHPETFERVPLRDDQSGENAVVIPFPE